MKPTTLLSWAALAGVAFTTNCQPDDACGPSTARVSHVVDGDTLDIEDGNRIRILGIDAPETGVGAECGGWEAHAALAARTEGRQITLSYDATCRDRYGRLLAHVWVDGALLGLEMLASGFACPYFPEPDGVSMDAFVRAAQVARAQGLGIWGTCHPSPCE